jgi:hypothetical protein
MNLSTSKGDNMMRKFLALFICLCVFFPLAVAAMTLTSVRPWVLDRAFYERIVNDGRITVRSGLDMAILVVIVMTIIVGGFLAYVGGDDTRGRLRWLGASFLVPASLFVLMGVSLATPLIDGPLRAELSFTHWDGILYCEAFQQAIGDMVISITQRVGNGFLLTGVVTCLIALFLIGLSWRASGNEHHSVKIVQVPVQN